MKLLKATLAFVLGLVLGIILLVLAIGGTVVALGTTRTVGDIQSAVTNEQIISPDSELYGQTVLEAVQKALHDYQNFDDITLKLLYERYGIDLLKGISGLDFTQKSFYDKPLTDIINDLSILLDDIYLSDIEKVAGLDFLQYNIPLINENMNVGLKKALDNMMKLVNDDLTLRTLKNKLNLDLGAEANGILSALQDVKLKSIGGLIDALRLDALLTSDTDTYLFKGVSQVYLDVRGTADEWEEVSEADLKKPDYKAPVGVETYIAGGDEEGNLIEKEMRYYKYEGQDPVADNSCYNDGWTCPEGATVLRHRLYKPFTGNGTADGKYVVQGYANRVETVDTLADHFTLLAKEFVSLDDIYVDENGTKIAKTLVSNGNLDLSNVSIYYALQAEEEGAPLTYEKSGGYSILDDDLTKDCLLRVPAEPTQDDEGNPVLPDPDYKEGRDIYLKSHGGTSSPLIQYLTYLTIGYIRNDTDAIIKNVHIGDIIDTDAEGVADVLKALKDSTLDSIGEDINSIPFGKMFGESDNQLLNAIKDFTLATIDQDMDKLTLGDIIDTTEPDTPPILVALKDCHFDELSEKVNSLKLSEVMTIDESSPQILRALAKHDATLSNMNDVIQKLSVGELLEVEYDIYAPAIYGAYVRMYYYTEFNSYVDFEGTYGDDAVRGDYDKGSDVFTPNEEGDWVKTYYYVLYDKNHDDADVTRYTLTKPGGTALAVQSLARRGVPALEMGKHLNDLSIGELMRIDLDSAQLFKTLSRRPNSNLDNIANAANELTIGEIIEIDEHSSKIMKSLAARNCTLGNMATITDELTLSEILDIVSDPYSEDENGIYVRVFDHKGYVLYDESNHDHEGREKFVKDGDEFRPFTDGDEGPIFVHSSYYTLYNPAVHYVGNKDYTFQMTVSGQIARFTKGEYTKDPANPNAPDAPSSKILQRFAGSTMGDFSTAFDEIMLSDVMDIDADIYAAVTPDDIFVEDGKYVVKIGDGGEKTQVTAYYYDDNAGVYRIANEKLIQAANTNPSDNNKLYYIATLGGGTAILRKLAFVKINKLEDAMNAVMQDLMLSEIIDVYKDDAVIKASDNTPEEDGHYFIEWDNKTKINDKPAVYVYEATGKYFLTNFYDEQIFDGDERLKETSKLYYVYDSIGSLNTTSNLIAYKAEVAKKLLAGNLYIKDKDEYVWNLPYASYLALNITLEDSKNLYYRKTDGVTSGTPDAKSVSVYDNTDKHLYVMNVYSGDIEEYKADPSNPALDINNNKDLKVSTIKAPTMKFYYRHQEPGKKYFAPISDSRYEYSGDVKYGAQYCNDVYFKIDSTEFDSETGKTNTDNQQVYVFNGVGYDEYNKTLHAEATDFYIKKLGFVASIGEAYYKQGGGYETTLNPQKVEVERQRSSSVLRMLADKTINEMNDVIKEAKMGDLIEITPGTIFDNEKISAASISDLGIVLSDVFTNMTIGELLGWSNITGVETAVVDALNDVTLMDFFRALEFHPTQGAIVINMGKLYGHTE